MRNAEKLVGYKSMCKEEKSEMDIIYEQYLERDDIKVEIDGRVYYRIIHKDKLSINGGLVLVMVPWELFAGGNIKQMIVDENENTVEFGSVAHYSFRRPIPQWYLKAVTLDVKNIKDMDEIGDYLALL